MPSSAMLPMSVGRLWIGGQKEMRRYYMMYWILEKDFCKWVAWNIIYPSRENIMTVRNSTLPHTSDLNRSYLRDIRKPHWQK